MKPKLVRITTVPISLEKLLEGQLQYMSKDFNLHIISSNEKYLKKIAQREDVTYTTIGLTRKITPIRDLIALFKMIRVFYKLRPNIVHSHTPKAGTIGMLAAWISRVPNRIHTVAGLPLMESTGVKFKILKIVEKLTYACASKIYPNSMGLKDYILREKLTDARKITIIGNGSSNGINTNYFSRLAIDEEVINDVRTKWNINKADKVLLFVGRVVKDKGINELLKSFKSISDHHPDLKLVIVGPLEEELNPISSESFEILKNHPRVIHTGFQNDVRPFFAVADLFVFPSYREGFPNVVLQAGAMEVPSIVSNINGCNEIIRNEENGLIVEAKNEDRLRMAILSLIQGEEKLRKLKSNTRQIIVQNYERSFICKELLKEYKSLSKI
ncbi:glycosyltransferase family 4 protein [Nonlabens sp. SCSIO 43208]|uniref:glycosyltransferase family 4 protein n=1 Tax=Nonlabens sp. SCSIO 43208 TaxID=2793009 RepID=UPI003D6A5E0F